MSSKQGRVWAKFATKVAMQCERLINPWLLQTF